MSEPSSYRLQAEESTFRHIRQKARITPTLKEIDGVSLTEKDISKSPRIPLSTLVPDKAVGQFLDAIAWAIKEVKSAQSGTHTEAP